MDLTLPQRLYLLSYDLDRKRFDSVSTGYRGQLLSAAALAELTVGGWLHGPDGSAVRTPSPPPVDPFLAAILSDIPPDRPRHMITALYLRMAEAEKLVQGELLARGAVTVTRGRALGLFPTRTVTLNHPERVAALREETREVLLGGRDAATAPFEDIAMIVIAAEADVWSLVGPKERSRYRATLTLLQRRFDEAAPELRNAIRTAVTAVRSNP
ncbi:GPP34 family phosphoprotein [Spiractinospora alimapuensis]|uniref:GOLPH3/VPS74 family protein n=1 Tax=Spiractinospora alimapuensis TaxID=2820884 RepID=UPI001F1C156A|nr:GPP34 family phosphoprotein [Spiractinospora alimapuensis]QVQ53785.1 GPP34 family phosphoprotein [Spiractinospora alimapuensis]